MALAAPLVCRQACQALGKLTLSANPSITIRRSLWNAFSRRLLGSKMGGHTPMSSQGTATTIENITLLSFPEDIAQEAGSAGVDAIWSLQYMVPGTLCGAAGTLAEVPVAELQKGRPAAGFPPRSFTHAVMLRFSSSRGLAAFQQHARYETALSAVLSGGCEGLVVLSVPTQLPNDLESLFRRGGGFDTGFELITVLQQAEGASRDDAEEVLHMLQQLAESSAFGAVQAAQGPCTAVQQMDGEPAASLAPSGGRSGSRAAGSAAFAADYVLMARFQLQEQLQDYLGSPPVAALLQADDRLPLRTVWAGVMEIAPADNSQTRNQGRGGLL